METRGNKLHNLKGTNWSGVSLYFGPDPKIRWENDSSSWVLYMVDKVQGHCTRSSSADQKKKLRKRGGRGESAQGVGRSWARPRASPSPCHVGKTRL